MVRVGTATKPKKKSTTKKKAQRKKKVAAKPEAKKSDSKKSTKDYKDLGMAYLAGGNSAVEKMIVDYGMKPPTIRKAAKHVEDHYPEKADMLRKFVEKNYPDTVRGRMAPVDGEVRDYKPQQIKEGGGGPFLRLPLDILGVKVLRDDDGEIVRKDIVRVKFTEDKIEVWKKRPEDEDVG